MNSQNNPFVLPGFGQVGDFSQNPLLASMEMMRQAWQGLASSGVLTQPTVSAAFTTEELDRRISDLRAVENWLRVNMSMLSSSIQALEVQRATIATLKSFANVPGASTENGPNPSPLEVALGIKPSGQAKIKPASPTEEDPNAASDASAGAASEGAAGVQVDPAALSGAAQGWWDLMQKQFDALTTATVAGMQAGQADAAGSTAKKSTAARKASAKRATGSSGARRSAGKTAASDNKPVRKRAVRRAS